MSEILIRAAEPEDMADLTEAWNQPLAIWGTLQLPFASLAERRKRFAAPAPGATRLERDRFSMERSLS